MLCARKKTWCTYVSTTFLQMKTMARRYLLPFFDYSVYSCLCFLDVFSCHLVVCNLYQCHIVAEACTVLSFRLRPYSSRPQSTPFERYTVFFSRLTLECVALLLILLPSNSFSVKQMTSSLNVLCVLGSFFFSASAVAASSSTTLKGDHTYYYTAYQPCFILTEFFLVLTMSFDPTLKTAAIASV